MKLDVQVCGRTVASLYRERDEYVLRYLAGVEPPDFVSLAMPVRDEPWRWPRDLHPFFRQNLPEGTDVSFVTSRTQLWEKAYKTAFWHGQAGSLRLLAISL